jgi:hypothetical protein
MLPLKGHGNEADFLGILQILGLRRVGESAFECLKEKSESRRVGDSPTQLIGESLTPRLGESESRRLPD